ncbi:MAG: PH domain-containing protein [Pirellulales bacterium]|nr:PH domain-containing protein [Pirellulales bacterium]
MNCPSCGTEVVADSIYCHQCGERVTSGTQPAEPSGAGSAPAVSPATQPAGLPGAVRTPRPANDDVEKELWVGRYSAKDMIGIWALDALVTIALAAAGFHFQQPVLWWAVLGAVVCMWGYPFVLLLYRRLSVRYRLTTQRFFHEQGILRHVTDRIEVIDMDDISSEQSILQRLVNVGRIRIASSDRSHPELVLNGIEDVRRVATMMDDARRAERMRRGLHIEAV